MQKQAIVKPVTQTTTHQSLNRRIVRSRFGIFSIILFCTLLYGVYQWYSALEIYLSQHGDSDLNHYQLAELLELNHLHSFQETVLKYKVYLCATCGYVEPNIVLAICILLTFPLVVHTIEKETATSIVFFQYNGISIYLQLLRLGLDGFQYLLTGRCYCLNSGAAAVWVNMLTKVVFHRLPFFLEKPLHLIPVVITFLCSAVMVILRARVDICLGVVIGLIEVLFMRGGTVKYPKDVFQEKQNWMQKIAVNRLRIWHPFRWNDYRQNQFLCLDNEQFYISKEERLIYHKN